MMHASDVRVLCCGVVLVSALFALPQSARADNGPCEPPPTDEQWQGPFEEQGGVRRESSMVVEGEHGEAPLISFIDSPSATCYQPNKSQNQCYINWYYVSVSADPNYMICMYVKVNAIGTVSHTMGFFQTSMYVPYNMYGQGFRVPCGALGSGGYDDLGAAYAYIIRAKDSAGLRAANYGTVFCPAHIP